MQKSGDEITGKEKQITYRDSTGYFKNIYMSMERVNKLLGVGKLEYMRAALYELIGLYDMTSFRVVHQISEDYVDKEMKKILKKLEEGTRETPEGKSQRNQAVFDIMSLRRKIFKAMGDEGLVVGQEEIQSSKISPGMKKLIETYMKPD